MRAARPRVQGRVGLTRLYVMRAFQRVQEPVHHLCARGGQPLDTLSTVPLCTRPAQVGGRGASRRAHLFTGSTVVVSATWWAEAVAAARGRGRGPHLRRGRAAAEQWLNGVLAGQRRPRGDKTATAPRRAHKSWLIRERLLGPAPPAWASHTLTHSFSHIRVRLSNRLQL